MTEKKKILIVANLAGFASFLINDIDTLTDMGYVVHFAANADKLRWEDTRTKLEERNVEFHQIDFDSQNPLSSHNAKAFLQIRKILKLNQYEVIHCHTPIAGLITRLAAFRYKLKGKKVIYTTHGFAFTKNSTGKKDKRFKLMEKMASLLTDAIITINTEDFKAAKSFMCKQVYYIPGVGVDTARYSDVEIDRKEYRNSIGVNDDDIMVLSVGELSARKNHKVIIEAISLSQKPENYVYVVCGNGINGGTGAELTKLAEKKKVKLLLLGFRHDIPEITKCSDIGAIPSLREGLGLAGVQSLAAGVPLVGSDVQGIKDYIINGETGYLCGSNDAAGYAAAIDTLARLTLEEKNKFIHNCQKMARKFDIKLSRKQMKEIYEGLLK